MILAAGTGMQMFGSDTRECAVRCDGCLDVNIATPVTHNSCHISVTYQTVFVLVLADIKHEQRPVTPIKTF